jgi:aspartate kinase
VGLVVQKYGGTSVANAELIRGVALRIVKTHESGRQVVAVVSAMGDTTDQLLALARQISDRPNPRELDLLQSTGETVAVTLVTMAVEALGTTAISLTGGQAGIRTSPMHGRARIEEIDASRVRRELEEGNVVVVAGFQGVTEEMDVTTFGRGGSNITAVALAAALHADLVENYTDVEGIFTADPRLEPRARRLRDISYQEMMELATWGAQVMHPRAVEMAAVYDVPILVRSSFSEAPGTLIHGEVTMEDVNRLRGIAADANVAKITILGVPDRPGIAAALFEPLAAVGVSVDVIVQNASVERVTDLTFTVARSDLSVALEVVQPMAKGLGALDVISDATVAKVSAVGTGMQNAPGYAARMFRALAEAAINIEMITTSEIRITCIIGESQLAQAVRVLHAAFDLESEAESPGKQ